MADNWSSVTVLPVPSPETGVANPSGRILVFSPGAAAGTLRVDRFDPKRNTWTRRPDLAGGIQGAKAVAGSGGIVYIVGVTVDGRHGRTLAYDATAGTWHALAPMPTPGTDFGIAVLAGKIYVLGGRVSQCCTANGHDALDVVERYDIATDSWTRLGRMPRPDADPGAVAAVASTNGTQGSIDGGSPGTPTTLYLFLPERVWIFEPAIGTWTPGPASLRYGETGSRWSGRTA
ncbi:MAG TPA: kelch repeat-containing protein [Candidatus Limnocylindrales bacterium]|nr:kelch repeat-containing protein [Candidatus Limnocylindrales bacterium]